MEPGDKGLSRYFNSIPVIPISQIKDTVARFETAKDIMIKKFASHPKYTQKIVQIYNNIIENDLPLSDMVCDCEGGTDQHIAVTMRSAKVQLAEQIQKILQCQDQIERYKLIYWLKLKSNIILKVLRDNGDCDLAEIYLKARNDVIAVNLRLVIHTVKPLNNKGVEFIDLIQEGNVGLMAAIDKYDYKPHRITKFTTMAVNWIWLYASRSVSNDSKTVRVPVYVNNNTNRMNKAIGRLTTENHRTPTAEELSTELGMTLGKLEKVVESAQKVTYIINDNNHFDDDSESTSYIEGLPDKSSCEDDIIRKMDLNRLKEKMESILVTLPPRQEKAIRLKYAIYTDPDNVPQDFMDGLTGQKFEDELGVSHQRASVMLDKGHKKLKASPAFRILLSDFSEQTEEEDVENHLQDALNRVAQATKPR